MNIDKLLFDVKSRVENKSSKQVKSEINNRTRARIRRKEKRDDSTLEVIKNEVAQEPDWNSKKKKRRFKIKDDIFKWGVRDVAFYLMYSYKKHISPNWEYNIIAICPEITRLHDRIMDVLGFCDWLVVRDYIDYIFEEHIRILIERKGHFEIRDLKQFHLIQSFVNNYNYDKSLQSEIDRKQDLNARTDENNDSLINTKMLNDSYMLSQEEFIYDYGIIIGIYFLIRQKKYSNKDAACHVLNICKRIKQKGNFYLVKEATEKWSPYPNNMNFPKLDVFMEHLQLDNDMRLIYSKSKEIKNKFNF